MILTVTTYLWVDNVWIILIMVHETKRKRKEIWTIVEQLPSYI